MMIRMYEPSYVRILKSTNKYGGINGVPSRIALSLTVIVLIVEPFRTAYPGI